MTLRSKVQGHAVTKCAARVGMQVDMTAYRFLVYRQHRLLTAYRCVGLILCHTHTFTPMSSSWISAVNCAKTAELFDMPYDGRGSNFGGLKEPCI